MSNLPTEKSFLKDVESHAIAVIRDDGVHRHVRFKDPSTMCMHFDLITWPGYLCYTGDMGTYVFTRLRDMFEFFRTDADSDYLKRKGLTLGINPSYWGEKLEAVDRCDGFKEFDEDKFNAAVYRYLVQWIRDNRDQTTKQQRRDLWEEVENDVINADSDSGGFRKQCAAHDFHHRLNSKVSFVFQDFYEINVESYSHRFMWCCYALAWGIALYDKTKEAANANS
jgi:hypothetical protein